MNNTQLTARCFGAAFLVTLGALMFAGCGEGDDAGTTPTPAPTPTPPPEPEPEPAPLIITMYALTETGNGEMVGTVAITDSGDGAVFTPDLSGLTPGEHGFHVHMNPDCGPSTKDDGTVVAGGAAAGHYDPEETGRHEGPEGNGHLGDLPRLVAEADGTATTAVTAPRITDRTQVVERALMIHAGGDNYSDEPAALGGGGGRFACGVIG